MSHAERLSVDSAGPLLRRCLARAGGRARRGNVRSWRWVEPRARRHCGASRRRRRGGRRARGLSRVARHGAARTRENPADASRRYCASTATNSRYIDAANCGNPMREMVADTATAAAQLDFFRRASSPRAKGSSIPMGPDVVNFSVREPVGRRGTHHSLQSSVHVRRGQIRGAARRRQRGDRQAAGSGAAVGVAPRRIARTACCHRACSTCCPAIGRPEQCWPSHPGVAMVGHHR